MNTNENLPRRRSKRHPDPLRTGAASFKRVLGSHANLVLTVYRDGASFIGMAGNRKSSNLPESAGKVIRNVCGKYPITTAQT